jgi:arylsulfatase A-like enzyme
MAVVGALGLGAATAGLFSALPGGSAQASVRPGVVPAADSFAGPAAPGIGAAGRQRVLIISEDGMRPDLIHGQRMPWHEKLYRAGAYSWHARTIRTASTLPSHASMLSGVDVNLHRLTWNNWRPSKGFIQSPTIFKFAKEGGMKTAAFVGKFKLRHILPAGTVGVFERPGYYCKKVSEEAARYLEREKPDLAFVHFSDPDEAGHSAGWMSEKQRQAAQASDNCLGTIYQALERAGTLDQTLIIVSADHGGHNHNHSGALACDREIPWIARGPGVRQGYSIRSKISTMDTAPTAMMALGLPLPDKIAGKPVREIFQ